MRLRSPLSFTASLIFVVAAVWVVLNVRRWNNRDVLQWDSDAFYLYLPASLIHHDLRDLRFLEGIEPARKAKDYRFGQGVFRVGSTGHFCNKYPIGTAFFELPFFLGAHAVCVLFPRLGAADGYSPPYHLAVALASAIWPWLGLLVLIRFLRRYLADAHIAVAILGLSLGTNLFFYASFASGMSHPFLFFLLALLIERTDAWYRSPSLKSAACIGICVGWAVLARPTDMIFGIVPLCWWIGGRASRREAMSLWSRHRSHIGLAAIVATVCVLPQLIYWHFVTGQWIYWSYQEEGFHFIAPHIREGLFGFRKGWFVYSPIVLLACAGLPLLLSHKPLRSYGMLAIIFLVVFIYVAFSWWCWWYGGGLGSRPMVETLALLALPFGMIVQRIAARGKLAVAGLIAVVLVCIGLNMFQQWQYLHGILHYEDMNAERYWNAFGAMSQEAAGVLPAP